MPGWTVVAESRDRRDGEGDMSELEDARAGDKEDMDEEASG